MGRLDEVSAWTVEFLSLVAEGALRLKLDDVECSGELVGSCRNRICLGGESGGISLLTGIMLSKYEDSIGPKYSFANECF